MSPENQGEQRCDSRFPRSPSASSSTCVSRCLSPDSRLTSLPSCLRGSSVTCPAARTATHSLPSSAQVQEMSLDRHGKVVGHDGGGATADAQVAAGEAATTCTHWGVRGLRATVCFVHLLLLPWHSIQRLLFAHCFLRRIPCLRQVALPEAPASAVRAACRHHQPVSLRR